MIALEATSWPLIGREAELGVIRGALRERSVVVVAPAGAGKSRLARAAVEAEDAALTGWVQATRSAAEIPLGAFAGLLSDEVRTDDVSRLLVRSAESLRERADGRRIVLGVDDAQLLDPVSASLVALLADGDVRVVATVRSGEPVPEPIEALSAERVELAPLDARAVAALLESVLGGPVEEAAVSWIAETSRGLPLYVRELVAGAVASGALARLDGLWQLASRPAVSGSLRELIAARLSTGREVAELLSLSEPLTMQELSALTSDSAVRDARAIVVVDADRVRLAHPLFGEVAVAELGVLRGRRLRLQVAETLQRRAPITSDDALRIARLLLDAGAEFSGALRLDAARAALLAGDADFGAQLAEPALGERGLVAPLLLARAHLLRSRDDEAEAALSEAEPQAPGDPQAFDYLQQRIWNLTWRLGRASDSVALLDRALGWAEDPIWTARVTLLRRMEVAIAEGFSVVEDVEAALADPSIDADDRVWLQSFAGMTALYAGDVESAVAIAERIRPAMPLRSFAASAAFATWSLVAIQLGDCRDEVEAFAADALRSGVRGGDHVAAGGAALLLGFLQFMRGRYIDTARWLTEAELHYRSYDPFGACVVVHAFQVGVAAETGDFDGAAAGLASIDAGLAGHAPLPTQVPFILRAQGWAARMRSDAEAAEHFQAASEQLARAPIFAATCLYEALRAGADVAPRLRQLTAGVNAPLLAAFNAYADAREQGGAELLEAAEAFAAMGALRYGMEAAAEASAAFLRDGRRESARRAADRARALHQPGQGTEPPRIDGLESPAAGLTAREAQIVDLARRGLSNTEIAKRLLISQRTIETHLYRAMLKLGVNDRRRL